MTDIQHRTVFIGNIPYDATEQQIRNILNTVGPIQSLRLVNDSKTGKPKGYGFAEYNDAQTAASAIRNLNNTDLNGRSLRVDTADDEKNGSQMGERTQMRVNPKPFNQSTGQSINPMLSSSRFSLGSQAAPSQMPIAFTADALHTLSQSLTRQQRVDMLIEMKKLLQTNPEGAKQLLIENPHLTHLLLQCQVAFGLVRLQDIEALQRQTATVPTPAAQPVQPPINQPINQPPQQYVPPPQQQFQPMQPPMQHMQPMQPPPSHYMPPTNQPINPQYAPPHGMPPHQPTHQPTHQQPSLMMGMASTEELLARIAPLPAREREIVQELLKLTPDELKQLPQEAQQQVFTILQSIGIS